MCVRVFFTAGFAREGKEEGLFRLGWRAEASEGQRGSCFVLSFIGGSCLSSTGGDQQPTLRTYTGASTLRVRTHMRRSRVSVPMKGAVAAFRDVRRVKLQSKRALPRGLPQPARMADDGRIAYLLSSLPSISIACRKQG